jgi:hypothetical protein
MVIPFFLFKIYWTIPETILANAVRKKKLKRKLSNSLIQSESHYRVLCLSSPLLWKMATYVKYYKCNSATFEADCILCRYQNSTPSIIKYAASSLSNVKNSSGA